MDIWTGLRSSFFALPVWGQWLIISAVKSVAASTLMSFLAVYATAVFAVRHGFRVPVEGVPYINFAVALCTFATFGASIVIFSLLMFFLRQIKFSFEITLKF